MTRVGSQRNSKTIVLYILYLYHYIYCLCQIAITGNTKFALISEPS